MADFDICFSWMLPHEDDPAEPGKITHEPNGGIAKYGVNSICHPEVDVANLTLDGAMEFYRKEFWSPVLEQIDNQDVANKIFDESVNLGQHGIALVVNQTLHLLTGCPMPRPLDGEMVAAINALPSQELFLLVLRYCCAATYIAKWQANPSERDWLRNFLRRAAE